MFHTADEKELKKITDDLLKSLRFVFGEEIICALIHGSTVKGGMIKGFSDLDAQVFLKETMFDEFGLKLEKSLAIQEIVGDIDLTPIGASYIQMYFHNPKNMPKWYTPPVAKSYKILIGNLPKELDYNMDNFKLRMESNLENLNETIAHTIRGFTDSSNKTLPRRVRYLATVIFPTMYSFLSYNIKDPSEIWALPKNEIYRKLVTSYQNKPLGNYLIKFFELISKIANNKEDIPKHQEAFETGINVLKEFYRLYYKK